MSDLILSQAHWDEAVRRNIITQDQRAALSSLAGETLKSSVDSDVLGKDGDQPFRLIGGGNDVFVTVGIILLFAGGVFILSALFGEASLMLAAIIAGISWLVAEFITRQKRMKLSSTILAVIFGLSSFQLLWALVESQFDLAIPENPVLLLTMRDGILGAGLMLLGGSALLASAYFWRFRVPILAGILAVIATALIFLLTALSLYDGLVDQSIAIGDFNELIALMRQVLYVPLICGIGVFMTGVWLDLKDRERISIWSDCAFWLHIVSAPLLVHPLFIMATGQDFAIGSIEPGITAGVLLALMIIGFVYIALIIDRRSLLVPTLGYFGGLGVYAGLSEMASNTHIPPMALVLMVIGTMIIIFGAGWQRIRHLVMRWTLPDTLIARLPAIRLSA